MIRALYTAASGMSAQQMNLDTIANNLANSSTTGFRQLRLQFQDMIYQNLVTPGAAQSESTVSAGLQIGLGTGVNSNGWYQWGGQSRTTADMAVTNTTSLTNVPGLSITVISGRNYYFEFDGVAQGIASGNGGVAFGISGSASLSNSRYFATGIAGTAVAGSTTNTALSLAPVSGVGNSVFCQMRGSFTAGTSGTVTIQFAQQSSNTTASTLLRGATFNAWDSP